ncbi:MAG: LytTR family transcriptional regulator [Marinilabiliaceae bacterium]|nr:LytTR family transcriptional regulator [Marinilabiliaceae bacterium]
MIEKIEKFADQSRTIISTIIGTAILSMLVALYGNFSAIKAMLLSFIYITLQIFGVFVFQSSLRAVKIKQIRWTMVIIMQIVPLLTIFVFSWIFGIISIKKFVEIIPLISVFGVSFFGITVLWHEKSKKEKDEDEHNDICNKECLKKVSTNVPKNKNVEIERISVKQGSDIHIIKTTDIFYIEAYGDYVLIYTEATKFIKEQTMYYFESVLPAQFVRIHRSYIVNTDFMIRLELFGKESYNIRLKNGVTIKASKAGYKLLKDNIGL